jgi:hypothetical protein
MSETVTYKGTCGLTFQETKEEIAERIVIELINPAKLITRCGSYNKPSYGDHNHE